MIFQSTLPTRGSDHKPPAIKAGGSYFNPRSPRGGATLFGAQGGLPSSLFQSTLPTRGSDGSGGTQKPHRAYFNPRSPRGGATHISIMTAQAPANFNPRSPRGGATIYTAIIEAAEAISIHAPHEGERRRKSAFVCSISANLLNIIHCGTVTRAVSRRRIALFRLFSVRRSDVFMYAYASH